MFLPINKINNARVFVVFLLFMILIPILVFGQGEAVKRARLEAQIAEIEREIASLDGDLDEVQEKKKTLENEVYRLNTEIKRTELTIKGLNLSISRAGDQITLREINIDEAQSDMEKRHSSLAEYIRMLHKYTDRSLVEILLSKDLTTFFREIDVLEGLQENAQVSLGQLKVLKNTLEKEQTILQREREDFYSLRALENNQKQTLAGQRSEKDGLLKVTKGEEAVYQNLISNKKRDIAAIRSQIFYLEQTGITAEDAVKYAELAAQRAGIRPAFLLGLLEVETGRRFAAGVITAGSNLGSGNWQDDMVKCYERLGTIYYPDRKLHFFNRARTEEKAFLEITSKLGFDPNSVKVSAEPSYGCGGAMGPAQFIPSTWLLFENRVAKLTGRSPANPWVVEDAFTAAALYLADAGATSKSYSGENGAARAYIGGSRTCSSGTCVWYSKEVLRVAALIDKNL